MSRAGWQLLTREACGLCDEAYALLRTLEVAPLTLIDIEDDLELEISHGLRIPVLRHPDSGRELDWPFDAQQVSRFIASECGR